ncbi:MAG: HAD family hydrolase, partial [Pyramidobacter sp.]|nr:HAD family hydrolase [Pyramidobacter sp.]
MIRAVLFDFDMTLIDSSDALLSNINKMAEHFGRPSCTRALLLECIGLNSDAFWEAIFSGFSDEHEAYYVSECLPHEHEKMRAFDGSFECVRALKAAGIKVGCASNRNTPVRVLSMTGLAPLMDCIVGACDVEHPKPAPDVILRGMELLGSAPQETAYIGDTPIDV